MRLFGIDEEALSRKLPRIQRRYRTVDSFEDEEIPIYFRFRSKDQLRLLKECFQFPEEMRTTQRHRFYGEEVLLVGLDRLHAPTTLVDSGFRELFGMTPDQVSLCTKLFLRHMVDNWKYLLFDNMEYWKPMLAGFAECVRLKVSDLGCDFPLANDPHGGFNVFGFIDNTMNATCRPGGGPTTSGAILREMTRSFKELSTMVGRNCTVLNIKL